MSNGDSASQLADSCAQLSLQNQAAEAKDAHPVATVNQGQSGPEKKEQSRQSQRRQGRSEEKSHQRQCRAGAMCPNPTCEYLHPQSNGWVSSSSHDSVRFTDGRAAPQNAHASMGYHYSVEDAQYYGGASANGMYGGTTNMYGANYGNTNGAPSATYGTTHAMYSSTPIYGGAGGSAYSYQQPASFEPSVRVMQAYSAPYSSYDNLAYGTQAAYDTQPQQSWGSQYDFNPPYYDPNPSYQDDVERRAEQIGQGEGFGDSCPCCAGNPENCQAQQCAERGFCGCLFGAMDADIVDDTWKDEWFAASRTCGCCEGYIYRCKVQDDACNSGNCFCSHTKSITIPAT